MLCRSQISKIKSKPYNITFEKRHLKVFDTIAVKKDIFIQYFYLIQLEREKKHPIVTG